jgi:cellulose synthase/poly-beta-1,6-N-acetylglucosamine synthase-like glycosyltransferase
MNMLLFWSCAILLAYAHFGYPAVLRLLARRRTARPSSPTGLTGPTGDETLPRLSILLSVYNEEAVMARKIENFLALDYPQDLIELLVVSDGSTDATDDIVRKAGKANVRLLRQEGRLGKTAALNMAAPEASGDVLVFTDANSMFEPDAARRLASHFADPTVGLVSGRTRYHLPQGGESSGGVYQRYESFLREGESALNSIVGADGAIYALRASLYRPLPPRHINDFLHPIQAVLAGYRAVSDPQAVCVEPAEDRGADEFRRQTRIMSQSWDIFFSQLPELLAAKRFGYCWQLVSHKALRWTSVPLLAGSTLAGLALMGEGGFYVLASMVQLGFLALAAAGAGTRSGAPRVAFLFMLLNLAAVNGLVRYMRGDRFVTWEPRAS